MEFSFTGDINSVVTSGLLQASSTLLAWPREEKISQQAVGSALREKKRLAATFLHVTHHLIATIYKPYIMPCSQINNTSRPSPSSVRACIRLRDLFYAFVSMALLCRSSKADAMESMRVWKVTTRGCEVENEVGRAV